MTGDSNVAACEFEPAIDDVDTNVERMADRLERAGDCQLAVFPELCVTGYALDVARERAAPIPGPLTDPLVDLAATHETAIVAGVPERDGETLYNCLALVDGEGVQAVYRKQYPWGDEEDVFAAADEPVVAETAVGRVGFLLCYDLNFPEAALAYARRACDVLVVSAAWRDSYRADWDLLLRARALDGTCYTVGSNHAGDQHGREHEGGSLIANPRGTVVSRVDHDSGVATAAVRQSSLDHGREMNPVHETRDDRAE